MDYFIVACTSCTARIPWKYIPIPITWAFDVCDSIYAICGRFERPTHRSSCFGAHTGFPEVLELYIEGKVALEWGKTRIIVATTSFCTTPA